MQREKRSRACKLYEAYRIVALYRELFDACRFASTPTYRLYYHESAKNTARSKGQGQQNKHRRFLERSNDVMELSINTAKLKGQKVNVNPVFPRNVSRHVGLNRFEPDFPRNVSRHIDPVCNMGLCASIRLVFLTLVSHCFAFHRNVKFF